MRFASSLCATEPRAFILLLAMLLPGCLGADPGGQWERAPTESEIAAPTAPQNGGNLSQLWNDTIREYLKAPLWELQLADDASKVLTVPLHAAFTLPNSEWPADFHAHFRRFHENSSELDWNNYDEYPLLVQLHYFYLISQYLVLAKAAGEDGSVPPGLSEFLHERVRAIWFEAPVWQWEHAPFTGMRARNEWKLSQGETKPSFYRAITDEDPFLFGIAADLKRCACYLTGKEPSSDFLDEILETAHRTLLDRIVFNQDGGWLFQPGLWRDHPDYAYAGNHDKSPGLDKAPLANVSEDTSHSHRWPLWLLSLERASPIDSARRQFYTELRKGLEHQFFGKVYISPTEDFPAPRTTNYMDGHNGIYRWSYPTQGEGNGFGPYELSGTISLGWWAFLGSERARAMHADLAASYPLPDHVVDAYVGPNTSRTRHPLVTDPGSYVNGMNELLARLSAVLPSDAWKLPAA